MVESMNSEAATVPENTAVPDGQKISVLIPTRNGAKTIGNLLAMLAQQTRPADQILVVDSSSEDETVAIVKGYDILPESIPVSQFDHAGTRTAMCAKATGDILVFFTQDAIPVDTYSLQRLVDTLQSSPEIAVAYGRQLPSPAASQSASHLRHFNYPSQSSIRSFDDRTQYGFATIFASNSFAAYKRDALAEVGYFGSTVIFGEDTCTVGRLLQKGYKVAYVSEAAVYHSHNYSLLEELRRSFDIGVFHNSQNWLLATFGSPEGRGRKYLFSELGSLLQAGRYRALADFLIRSIVKIAGYSCGRRYSLFPHRLCLMLTMNRGWWHRRRNDLPLHGGK